MVGTVQFEDESRIPGVHPRSAGNLAAELGIPLSNDAAQFVVFLVATLMIIATIYLFALVAPEPPTLGDDVPRRGEIIPKNRIL